MTRRLFVGKLPEGLRRIARGEAPPDPPLERVDLDDPDVERFLEEMTAFLKVSGPDVGRDEAGALALSGRAEDGSAVRATEAALVVLLASGRPLAPLGEPGLREALREVVRLAPDLPGDGLLLDEARHEGAVVYAVYAPLPVVPVGRRYRRLVVWSDGDLLLVALRPRCPEAT